MSLTGRLRYGFISTREDGLGNIVELLLRLVPTNNRRRALVELRRASFLVPVMEMVVQRLNAPQPTALLEATRRSSFPRFTAVVGRWTA
jgi:hypothetical protein